MTKETPQTKISQLQYPVKIELGCGNRKRIPGSIGIDQLSLPAVDIVGDALAILKQFPDKSASGIYSWHFFEHAPNPEGLLEEISRVLVDEGELEITVPHFSNPYFYSDPTHLKPWGLYTLSYWVTDTIHARKTPHYRTPLPLRLLSAKLNFKTDRRFLIRSALKHALGKLVTLTRSFTEIYEDSLCWIFPCYEITYKLVRERRT